jgi:hypothetical protein
MIFTRKSLFKLILKIIAVFYILFVMNALLDKSNKDIFPIEANGTIKNKKIKEITKNFEKNESKYIFPIE